MLTSASALISSVIDVEPAFGTRLYTSIATARRALAQCMQVKLSLLQAHRLGGCAIADPDVSQGARGVSAPD